MFITHLVQKSLTKISIQAKNLHINNPPLLDGIYHLLECLLPTNESVRSDYCFATKSLDN
jgi:hypothetical protein